MNLPNPNPFPGMPGQPAVQPAPSVTTAPVQVSDTKPTYKFKKAGNTGTLITMIVDESGSMSVCRDSTITGFNEFVQGQRAAEEAAGAGFLTLVKFDAPHIKTVYSGLPLNEVPLLDTKSYTPNGGTNLLDAIGNAINNVNAVLSDKKKKDRPGVIITIMTDGAENSSRAFTRDQIKDMVSAAEKSDWTFQFLGANIDSFAVGSTFGMNVSNSVNYSTNNMGDTFASISASTSRMRMAKSMGTSTAELYQNHLYTEAELKSMKK